MESQDLIKKLRDAHLAYQLGRPIMTDLEYDILWSQLKSIDPTNPALFPATIPSTMGPIVQHNVPCLSLDKAMIGEELLPFLVRFMGKTVTVEPKFDGCFIRVYAGPEGPRAVLSGNGREGRDITDILYYVIPIPIGVFTDYEVVIPNCKWFSSMGSNQRNSVAGLLNRQSLTQEQQELLEFIPHGYHAMREEIILSDYDIPTWEKRCFNIYTEYLSRYPLDGVVIKVMDHELRQVVGHNGSFPHWAIAWKPPIQIAKTVVKKIHWQVSRTQRIVPVIEFEAVDLCNTLNRRATGNNAVWIIERGVSVGSRITVGKAGEIIPQILSVQYGSAPDLPKECPVCKAPVRFMGPDLVCTGTQCLASLITRLEFFYSSSGLQLKGIARGFFEAVLTDENVRPFFEREPWVLFNLSPLHPLYELLAEIVGGDKVLKIVVSANEVKDSGLMTHANFIAALGLPGVGWKSAMSWLLTQGGIASPRQTRVAGTQRAIEDNLDLILRGLQELPFLKQVNREVSRSYALTGTFSLPRQEIINYLQSKNWLYDENVTSKTDYLFCSRDSLGSSQKWKMANHHGVKILGERDLLRELAPIVKEQNFIDFIPGG